jgi:two-component system heavy metal sensor histidine kinase CusS
VEQLRQLLESQQLFVSHAAHELRSPIATIYARLSLALRRSRDTAEYRSTIEEAVDSMKGLNVLAEDLLTLAGTATDDHEETSPVLASAIIGEAIKLVELDAKTRALTLRTFGEEDIRVQGRPRDLERMLRNLLENAIRHSPAGGTVTIGAHVREGRVELAVSDEGPGVAAANRPLIFQPFFRGERERASGARGAGLGLAIAREIARHHHGDVTLDPAHENGARFVATLPLGDVPKHMMREGTAPVPGSASLSESS